MLILCTELGQDKVKWLAKVSQLVRERTRILTWVVWVLSPCSQPLHRPDFIENHWGVIEMIQAKWYSGPFVVHVITIFYLLSYFPDKIWSVLLNVDEVKELSITDP